MKIHSLKSLHCVPGIKYNYLISLEKIFIDSRPDAIILDLEDSVHVDYKIQARKNIDKLFEEINQLCRKYDVYLGLRINARNTPWHKKDLSLLVNREFDFVDVPKIECNLDINIIKQETNIPIAACVETIKGMHNLDDICSVLDSKKDFLLVGHEDPCADYSIERPLDLSILNPLSFFIMSCLTFARKYDLVIIDGPSREFREEYMANFIKECHTTHSWGMNGKITIHPRQINYTNDIFSKDKQRSDATKFSKVFSDLKDGSFVAVNDKGDMMDMPSYRMYQHTLHKSDQENKNSPASKQG